MFMENMFDIKQRTMTGKVIVKTRENPFGKEKPMLHVVRNVADDRAITTEMTKQTDLIKFGDMAIAMSAFVAAVKSLVEDGNAVRISGLGTIYITATQGDDGKPDFGVGFAADKSLMEAAQCAEAKAVMESEIEPLIENVQDMDTMEENGEISANRNVEITGKRLQTAGDDETTGVFMVPCDEDDNYKPDRSNWIRVNDDEVHRNFMSMVLFRVPNIKGRYRICVVTRSPLNGSRRKDKLLKHSRMGISAAMNVV